jgi:hypothetical protein
MTARGASDARMRTVLAPRRTSHPRAMVIAAAMATAAAVLGACGSDYTYVKAENRAVFKVPGEWAVFRVDGDDGAVRPQAMDLGGERPWVTAIDADPSPDLAHLDDPAPAHPVGLVRIVPLDRSTRDGLSRSTLRAQSTGGTVDPFGAVRDGDPAFELVSFEELSPAGDATGERIRFNQRLDDGTWITVDHSYFFDPVDARAYLFTVRCSSVCFEANVSTITNLVTSWKVRA